MTEYTLDAESNIAAVTATSRFGVLDSATSRYKYATGAQLAAYADSASTGALTMTASTGTLSNVNGKITTQSQTATGQAPVVNLVITNTTITTTDLLLATLGNGTNTAGIPVLTATPGAGIMTFGLLNAATTATNAFAGTFVISYKVIKA